MGYNPFITTDRKMSQHNKMLYRKLMNKQIVINLNKNMTYDILCYLLTNNFNLNIVGYNKITNEFYGKKTKKGSCLLQLNLKIIEATNNTTNILITPIIGSCNDIDKFIENFNKRIYTYV
jgi:uncharacterized membrane-anchored protein YitT (DUF2179 family)